MTDSKKPPSREEFQRLRETVAAQSEVIEDYLPDDPEKRKFLGEAAKGIGAVGALGIAGQGGYAVGQASAEASTSDTDTDIGSPSNRHDLFAEGVDANSVSTGNQSLTEEGVVYVDGVSEDGSATYRDAYAIADYTDIGAVIQQANDDLIAIGVQAGKITLPIGVHQYSTAPVVDSTAIEIVGQGVPTYQGSLRHGTILEYTGSETHALVFRGTADSPNSDRIDNLRLRRFGIKPDDGTTDDTHGILVDGTTDTNANGSVVRDLYCDQIRVEGFQGSGFLMKGTVFDQTFNECYFRGAPGLQADRSGATSGVSSQTDIFGGWVRGQPGGYGVDLDTGSLQWFGGSITGASDSTANGAIVRKCNGGGIYGTHIEAVGGTGLAIETVTSGPFDVKPGRVFSCDVGVNIGNGTTGDTVNTRVDFQANNNTTTDLLISDGGLRHPVVLFSDAYSIQNDRLSTDGEQAIEYIPYNAVSNDNRTGRNYTDWGDPKVSDTGTTTVTEYSGSPHGMLIVSDATNDHSAIVLMADENGASIVSQDASHFTTTSGNSGTVNVYRDGSGVYQIENQTGGSAQISWQAFVTYEVAAPNT